VKKRLYGRNSGPLSERALSGGTSEDACGYSCYGVPSIVEHCEDRRRYPADDGDDAL
jgi:hypothetical protein